MPGLLAAIALLSLTVSPVAERGAVRISLFSLFKPQSLDVRLASGAGALVDTGRLGGSREIGPGDQAQVRFLGDHFIIVLVDSYGRVKHSVTSKQARIIPRGQAVFDLILPGKMKRAVRGMLEVNPREARPRGWLQITLATDVESAVASVVAAEMYGKREGEALKALSVIARTFMLSHAGRHSDEGFDFCDTTHCQLYRGEADLASEIAAPVVARAVADTAGEVLSFGGRMIETYFTAVCGGLSATPEMVWGGAPGGGYAYQRVSCSWCRGSHYMRWERRAESASVLDALSAAKGVRLSPAAELSIEEEQPGGPVRQVIIRDKGRRLAMATEEFRRAIGLRIGWNKVLSPTFQIERRGRQFVFRGRGFGSQVGLCLAGTTAQAASGRGYRDILEFYYPRAEIRPEPAGEK
jgi:stage II sporulation protein D